MTGTWYDVLMKYVDPGRSARIKAKSPEPNPKAHWREKWKIENARESEGIFAGKEGKTREDCPYDRELHPLSWNFWVYGCENARGELEALKSGEVNVAWGTTGGSFYEPIMMPVAQAIQTGQWKPRYFSPTEAYGILHDHGFPVPDVSGGDIHTTGGVTVSGAPFATGFKIAEIGGEEDDDDSDLRGC